MKVVSNSSPLIVLSKINEVELLRHYFKDIFIPRAVHKEVVAKGKGKPGSEIKNFEWIKVKEIDNKEAVKSLQVYIGKGEAESIILAKELKADFIIMDDYIAREIAKTLGLEVIGAVAMLVRAKKDGLIESLMKTLDEMKNKGVWMDNELYQKALELSGEG